MWQLDGKVKLDEVADRFPRVLNRIAEIWKRPLMADRYFEELLHDTRGSRAGFPLCVLAEISELKGYHSTYVYPRTMDAWTQAMCA
jgi:hypothetical protein